MMPLEPAIAALLILTATTLSFPALLGYGLAYLALKERATCICSGRQCIDYDAPALQSYLGRVLRGPSATIGVAYILTILFGTANLPALSAGKSLLIVFTAFGTGIAVRTLFYLAVQCWGTTFVRRLGRCRD